MFIPSNDFEWNMLGIYNYNKPGQLSCYFEYLKNNLDNEGDLFEAGVFRGWTLLSVALFLKEKGSEKIVYGYDTFTGFPSVYNKNDSLENFDQLYKSNKIETSHYQQIKLSVRIRELINESNNSDPSIISTSNEFSDTSKILLEKKISFLGLDNVVLIEGPFSKTMVQSNNNSPGKLLAGIVDCDLYESYKTSLKFFWPKLIKSGALYIDEYFSLKYPGARIAVNEFLETHDGMLKKHQNDSFEFERWMLFKS